MNFETTGWRRQALEGEVLDEVVIAQRRKRRRIIIAAAIAAILLIAAFFAFAGGEDPATTPAAGEGAEALPSVTVIVPGNEQISRTISATGTLAARRDMPVGVAGEGGEVSRVLVEAGDWVNAGQALATIERSVQSQQARQLAAQIQVARAEADLAQSELDRALALVDRGFISKADVDRKTATRDAAVARVRVAEAQLAETRARIGRLDVRAPASGLVLDRMVEPGQIVGPGSGALFRIAMGGEMELVAKLSQEDLARVTVGVPATVTPVGSTDSYQGQVWQVSPVIDPQTRQGDARISIPYQPDLRPGGFASATIVTGAIDAPLLPESAVLSDEKGSYVYIVDQKDMVVRRPVRTGQITDEGVAIVEGLNGTERVVRSAGGFLNPGEKVRPVRQKAGR
ncbi:efflux RND transporter periplasmic adaptor subunit [Sphingosinicella humi]|uniref:Efflux RND transporter periplasmic adaptor subunit n=1 Tax=Allosphingosinicella humi TaxID=2068657 RepID=A0A2U2J438_9SPHN|nr:efflux RND transporter periplasmic adaptor subunit [Sphingosinicella humi]PWG03110.1 efflux RND transporter periplasmic adaptor subunit [Sphingosinicella humi]